MLVLGSPLGFFGSGIFSGLGLVLTELFPTTVRGAGQGFCYNFGRGIGAFFPTLVRLLSASVAVGTAIGIFAAISYAIAILAALALPETRARIACELNNSCRRVISRRGIEGRLGAARALRIEHDRLDAVERHRRRQVVMRHVEDDGVGHQPFVDCFQTF